jgi:hypothetical protein
MMRNKSWSVFSSLTNTFVVLQKISYAINESHWVIWDLVHAYCKHNNTATTCLWGEAPIWG